MIYVRNREEVEMEDECRKYVCEERRDRETGGQTKLTCTYIYVRILYKYIVRISSMEHTHMHAHAHACTLTHFCTCLPATGTGVPAGVWYLSM